MEIAIRPGVSTMTAGYRMYIMYKLTGAAISWCQTSSTSEFGIRILQTETHEQTSGQPDESAQSEV